jgi:UDP-N-acetylglucosamine 2-epimerase (non-hydrolysing)
VLVLRKVTERPEGVAAGTVKVIGTDAATIVAEASHLLDDPDAYRAMASTVNPYGDGTASIRIVKRILQDVAAQHAC